MKSLLIFIYIFLLFSYLIVKANPLNNPQKEQNKGIINSEDYKNGKLLDILVGEWEGSATAYFERDEERKPRYETIKVKCEKVLKDSYVKCNSVWTTPDGSFRELMIFWNYDKRSEKYEILFLYDNWPGKVNYQFEYNEAERTLNGRDTFTASGGVAAEEKVSWKFSEDGNEITGTEYNHYETDAENYWAKSFEYVWRRVR